MAEQDRTLIENSREQDRDELATWLEQLATQIREGHVRIGSDDNSVELELPERLHLNLECKDSPKSDGLKHELELEIWWLESN